MLLVTIRLIIAAITLILAAIFDLSKQRIPNFITFPAFSVGLILMCISDDLRTILINIICVLTIFYQMQIRILVTMVEIA